MEAIIRKIFAHIEVSREACQSNFAARKNFPHGYIIARKKGFTKEKFKAKCLIMILDSFIINRIPEFEKAGVLDA
ncbi:MAG: hypothetical protein J6P03_06600, partial [Opitutales bacterium]|nr:hypothetical protein [Opitutales bacterium]